MNIYLVERTDNIGYEQYDSFICITKNEQEARETHPSEWDKNEFEWQDWIEFSKINSLKVTMIGVSSEQKKRVVLTSFNAG